jgi:hypothetical protein
MEKQASSFSFSLCSPPLPSGRRTRVPDPVFSPTGDAPPRVAMRQPAPLVTGVTTMGRTVYRRQPSRRERHPMRPENPSRSDWMEEASRAGFVPSSTGIMRKSPGARVRAPHPVVEVDFRSRLPHLRRPHPVPTPTPRPGLEIRIIPVLPTGNREPPPSTLR